MLTVDNKDTYIIIIIDLYMEWIIPIRIVRHMNIRIYLTNKKIKIYPKICICFLGTMYM